jgi:hypothetical protein
MGMMLQADRYLVSIGAYYECQERAAVYTKPLSVA